MAKGQLNLKGNSNLDLKGPYKWGTTDCLGLVTQSLNCLGLEDKAKEWEDMVKEFRAVGAVNLSEVACMDRAKNRWGNVQIGLMSSLMAVGYNKLGYTGDRNMLAPYDILILKSRKVANCLGIVDEDKNIRAWVNDGNDLGIVAKPVIHSVFRISVVNYDGIIDNEEDLVDEPNVEGSKEDWRIR